MKSERTARTEAGLVLPVNAGVGGRFRWKVLDERGKPEVPRNPSGFAIGPIEGVEQPNLITDLGLDKIGTLNVFEENPGSNDCWRKWLAVGTGSTEPSFADTALAAEVQRSNTVGSFTVLRRRGFEGTGAATIHYNEHEFSREVTMSADRNLTELGFDDADGDLVIRELFRDELGDPVTVSLLSGKKLQLDHTLRVTTPTPTAGLSGTLTLEEYDASNTLVATTVYDVTFGFSFREGDGWRSSDAVLARVWNPFNAGDFGFSTDGSYSLLLGTSYISVPDKKAMGLDSYVSSSYERVARTTLATGDQNGTYAGAVFFDHSEFDLYEYGYLHITFDDPTSMTKASTDTLYVGMKSSWARTAAGSGSGS